MQFDLRAGPGELAEKGSQLLEALSKAFVNEAPELAAALDEITALDGTSALEKALPPKEPVLKYKVLKDIHKVEESAYKKMLRSMNAEILDFIERPEQIAKSEGDEGDLLKSMGWEEIAESVGELLWEQELSKASGHKYIRRVPTGKDKPKYRYFYNVTGGRGLGHTEEMTVGAKFSFDYEDEVGHFEVLEADQNTVTVRYDESGHTTKISRDVFAKMLLGHHGQRVESAVERATKTRQEAEKHGSEKQITRAFEHEQKLKRQFREYAGPGPKDKAEAIQWADVGKYIGPLDTKQSLQEAEDAIRNEGVEHAGYYIEGKLAVAINGVTGITPVIARHRKEMIEDGGAVFIHNHPSGNTFSVQDLTMAVAANVKEMRACHSGGTWVLTRPNGRENWLWPDSLELTNPQAQTAFDRYKTSTIVMDAKISSAARKRMDDDVEAAGGSRLEGINAKGYNAENWQRYLTEEGEKGIRKLAEQIGCGFRHEKLPERRAVARSEPQEGIQAGKRIDGLPTVAPALPRAALVDMGPGGFDQIESFSADATDLERQASVMPKDREYAVMSQAGGFALVSKPKSKVGVEAKGSETQVFIRSGTGKGTEALPGEWVIMEADEVIASHDPMSFGQRKEYPEDVQERRYHEVKAEQFKVDRIARALEPAFLANTNPDAINGAPIVTENGVVLGGNGRAMGMQRAYEMYPESAEKLKGYLVGQAHQFGASVAHVSQMKKPVLVRRVQVGEDKDYLTRLGRRMNESLTQGLDPRSEEVAVAKFVTKDVVQSLTHHMEADQTLSDFLTQGRQSAPFVRDLERAGIIDQFNRAKFINQDTGLLNEDGRARVMRVMAARLLPDATVLDNMDQSLRNNLAVAVPFFLQTEETGWDLKDALLTAVKADNEMAASGYKRDTGGRDKWLRQRSLLASGESMVDAAQEPLPAALLEIIQDHNGKRKIPDGFKRFALTSDQQSHDFGEQGSMFARPKVSMEDALAQAFKLKGVQSDLLAASWANRDSLIDRLVKAGVVDAAYRLAMYAIGWETKRLLDAAGSAAAKHGGRVDLRQALSRLQGFIAGYQEHDSEFKLALEQAPVSSGCLLAILEAEAQAKGLKGLYGPDRIQKSAAVPYDATQQLAETDARAYNRMKSVLGRRGYGPEAFEEGGRFYGYSTNQLIEAERELRNSRNGR